MKIPGMPTCKEVFSKRYNMEEMSFTKKMMTMVHMSMCKNCQNFQATMDLLEQKMKQTMNKSVSQADLEEIEGLKKKIKDELIK